MPKILGINRLKRKVKKLEMEVKAQNGASVVVGFTQSYAVHVHEDLTARHKVGSAKFLEAPARSLASTLSRIITVIVMETNDLRKALLAAGLRLQREAQKLTPVDTGALKASAFTAFAEDVKTASARAGAKSEKIRSRRKRR